MKWQTACSLALIAVSLMGCGPKIPLVGIDESGNPTEQWIPSDLYSQNLASVLSSMNKSVSSSLTDQDAKSKDGTAKWSVRTVLVGVVVNGDVGVGSYRIGGMERFRVAFSNSSEPALP